MAFDKPPAIQIPDVDFTTVPGDKVNAIIENEVIDKLGSGAYGYVMLVNYEGQRAALKRFNPLVTKRAATAEYAFLKYLNGKGGAPIPFAFCSNPLSLILTYREGQTLGRYLCKPGISDWEYLEIAAKVVSKVQEVHDMKVIHNDLKKGNIIVNDELEVFLIDFGLATFNGEAMGQISERILWLAPELAGMGQGTYASDAYSIGCPLSEVLRDIKKLQSSYPPGSDINGSFSFRGYPLPVGCASAGLPGMQRLPDGFQAPLIYSKLPPSFLLSLGTASHPFAQQQQPEIQSNTTVDLPAVPNLYASRYRYVQPRLFPILRSSNALPKPAALIPDMRKPNPEYIIPRRAWKPESGPRRFRTIFSILKMLRRIR
ncbi:tyrosine-protein kinase yes-like [Penaeus japonicus]|uniref:tyrosine-protein kinase yes-like n=1 Tax=Penaeus japonicus TaxID=27405 RepID=UPI001C70F796|nr:tyrosine-protein kinase yes-like [Penaeus japonicus]